MPALDVLTLVGFLVAFIAVSAATSDLTGIERRLRHLDRGDPATAEAVRRAQAVSDLARGGYFGLESIAIVCTPSRRSLHLSGDDEFVEPMSAPPAQPEAVTTTQPVRDGTPGQSPRRAAPASAAASRPGHPSTADYSGGANSSGHQPTASG